MRHHIELRRAYRTGQSDPGVRRHFSMVTYVTTRDSCYCMRDGICQRVLNLLRYGFATARKCHESASISASSLKSEQPVQQ